jgi:thiosulfate reductase cytochrome b subunit
MRGERIYRHAWPVRLMHWVNALCVLALMGTGLGILNAHPVLYWGSTSEPERSWLAIEAVSEGDVLRGQVTFLQTSLDLTGWLGVSREPGIEGPVARAFPHWATLPGPQSLATSRSVHLLFAWLIVLNGCCYLGYSLASGHLRRDLSVAPFEWRRVPSTFRDHLLLRTTSTADLSYNVIQKLAYLAVVLGVVPLLFVTGLAMSPMLNSLVPGWVDWLGGRQSARSLHFLSMAVLFCFLVIHLLQVLLHGPWNHIRSMVTGWYVVRPARVEEQELQ